MVDTSGCHSKSPSSEHGDTEGCLFKAQAGLNVMVKGQTGSGTGCCALQGMESCATRASPTAKRTFRWHQRVVNSSRVIFGSLPRSQALSTPDVVLTWTVTSRQSPRMAFLQTRGSQLPPRQLTLLHPAGDARSGRRSTAGKGWPAAGGAREVPAERLASMSSDHLQGGVLRSIVADLPCDRCLRNRYGNAGLG